MKVLVPRSGVWRACSGLLVILSSIAAGCGIDVDDVEVGFDQSQLAEVGQPDEAERVAVPAPGDRDVLAQGAVGPAGAVVSPGQVRVSVPSGAFTRQAEVSIREPLGEFGSEVSGEIIGVDHDGPVLAPITVVWDVSHLSDLQQRALVLVRWDEEVADWVPPEEDPGYEIVNGALTAQIEEWSNWVWNTIANVSQTFQEILGRRVDAPKCSEDDLHGWVESASETDTGFNADAIRLCFENGPGPFGAVRVKMANNRTFGQFVHFEGGDGFADPELSDVELSPSGLVRLAAFSLWTSQEQGRVYIPPLKTVVVDILRPTGGGSHHIGFRNEQTMETFILDVAIFVLDAVEPPNLSNSYFNAAVELLLECGLQEVAGFAQSGNLREQLQTAVNAVRTCTSQLVDPDSTLGTKLLDKMSRQVGGIDEAASQIKKGARALKKVFKLLKVAEFIGILADLILQGLTGSLFFFIRGQGRNPLGQWTPTCSDIPTDSIQLALNLAHQNIFYDRSIAYHEFEAWEPSVAIAVIPLRTCDFAYRTNLADYAPNDWGVDPIAGNIVRDHILALNANTIPEPLEELSFIGIPGGIPAVFMTMNGLGSPVQIGRSGDRYLSAVWSPDGTRTVVAHPAAENEYGDAIIAPDTGLFVMDSDGTELWQITPTGQNPSWSPDGLRIVYDDNDGVWRGDQGGFGVYVVSADGTGARQLVNWGSRPVWSPSGTQIMFRIPTGPHSSGLAVSQPDGSREWQIDFYCGPSPFPDEPFCGGAQTGAWSPDGWKIAYTYGYELYVVNDDGTGARRLVSGGEDPVWPSDGVWDPVWSPDGEWIAYVLANSSNGTSINEQRQLWVADAAGGRSEFVSDIERWSPIRWSPDSTRLAYVTESSGSTGVIVVSSLESNSGAVAVSLPDSSSPTWSQDNTRIAFSSRGNAGQNPERDTEIFVVNADGTNLIQVTDNAYDDYGPAWIVSR